MEQGRLLVKPGVRILITRADRIGDMVLTTPVFEAVRKKYPGAYLACLTFPENRDIVAGNPFLDEIILYDKKGPQKGFWGNLVFSRFLARRKFDVVVHFHATNRMHLVTRLAGIPVRIGWKRRASWTLTHGFEDCKREGLRHESLYNYKLLKPLGVPAPPEPKPCFPKDERADRSLAELVKHRQIPEDRPWVVISPSASCPSKRWPAEKFAAVARRLERDPGAVILVIGARGDRWICRRVVNVLEGRAFDLSGSLSLAMLGSLFRRSALLVTNDSGPAHIAAACDIPVISVFGRKEAGLSPARWKPLGEKSRYVWKDAGCEVCLAHRCEIGFLCLDAVSFEEVAALGQELLGSVAEKAGGVRR